MNEVLSYEFNDPPEVLEPYIKKAEEFLLKEGQDITPKAIGNYHLVNRETADEEDMSLWGAEVLRAYLTNERPYGMDHRCQSELYCFMIGSRKFLPDYRIYMVLLLFGFDLNYDYITTPLMEVLSNPCYKWKQTIALLLRAGAYINSTKVSASPLHCACGPFSVAPPDIIKLLLDCGADVNSIGDFRLTPFLCMVDCLSKDKNIQPDMRQSFKLIIAAGADCNVRDQSGKNALHMAAKGGGEELVRLLIAVGVDINAEDMDGNTPLHLAAQKGHIEAVEVLIIAGANKSPHNLVDNTPLHLACMNPGTSDVVKLLLCVDYRAPQPLDKYKTLHFSINKEGKSPIDLAYITADLEIIGLLLFCFHVWPDFTVKKGGEHAFRMLIEISNSHEESIRISHKIKNKTIEKLLVAHFQCRQKAFLIKEIDEQFASMYWALKDNLKTLEDYTDEQLSKKNYLGNTLVHIGCLNMDEELVMSLLQRLPALASMKNDVGGTPLHLTAVTCEFNKESFWKILNGLQAAHVDINCVNKYGFDALSVALYNENYDLVHELLSAGANFCSPKYTAKPQFLPGLFQELIRLGMNKDMQDLLGNTFLHQACEREVPELLKTLLTHQGPTEYSVGGSLYNSCNKKGKTPLMMTRFEHAETLELLSECIPDLNARDPNGDTLAHHLARYGKHFGKYLQDNPAVDLTIKNKDGYDPLKVAIESSQHETVSKLLEHHCQCLRKYLQDNDLAIKSKDVYERLEVAIESRPIQYEAASKLLEHHCQQLREYLQHVKNTDVYEHLKVVVELRECKTVIELLGHCQPICEVVQKHKTYKKACFQDGSDIAVKSGWLAGHGKNGALLVTDNLQEDPQYIVYLPQHKVYGILQNDKIHIRGGKVYARAEGVEFFYGLPELGTNLVWKPMNAEPMMFMNFYDRMTSFGKPAQILLRNKVNGKYTVGMIECSLEMLSAIGKHAIQQVYKDTEVLSLRNLCGEGHSLTLEEWEILHPLLVHFPEDFVLLLLDEDVSNELQEARRDIIQHERFQTDFLMLIEVVLKTHPHQGSSRLYNKLLSIIPNSPYNIHKSIVSKVDELYKKILEHSGEAYTNLTKGIDIAHMKKLALSAVNFDIGNNQTQVRRIPSCNQTQVSGIPSWFEFTKHAYVDPVIVLQLLASPNFVTGNLAQVVPLPSKSSTTAISSQFEQDLLAKAYIKVAHALRPKFYEILSRLFGNTNKDSPSDRVKMAPIKDLRRCQAKLLEAMRTFGNKQPYAATLCDYLRATVLCESMEEMLDALYTLRDNFKVIRVKPRIGRNPEDKGNKCILVNLVVEDPSIQPNKYPWSGWWDNKTVSMIAEVQIAIRTMYYLDKQAHSAYEIIRTKRSSEWRLHQGYTGMEKRLFPNSPLHNDPKCLL